jgi:acetyltransferase-like isoleucine patch superfamily enzyme
MKAIKMIIKEKIVGFYQWIKRMEQFIESTKGQREGCVIVGDTKNVKFGNDISLGGGVVLFASESIEIGDHTMIAMNVILHTATHNYLRHPMWMERIDRPIKIGKHVWIGIGAIITPGVIVEDFAVIGAGSVVVENVPRGSIVAGNPARIIKQRTDFEIQNWSSECPKYAHGAFATKKGYLTTYCKNKKNESE